MERDVLFAHGPCVALLRQRELRSTGKIEPNLAELLDLVALGTVADVDAS